eukprot:1161787-Pelagomonas_calceolata.AAC.3
MAWMPTFESRDRHTTTAAHESQSLSTKEPKAQTQTQAHALAQHTHAHLLLRDCAQQLAPAKEGAQINQIVSRAAIHTHSGSLQACMRLGVEASKTSTHIHFQLYL